MVNNTLIGKNKVDSCERALYNLLVLKADVAMYDIDYSNF